MCVLNHLHSFYLLLIFFSKSDEGHLISGLGTGGKDPWGAHKPQGKQDNWNKSALRNCIPGPAWHRVDLYTPRPFCLPSFGFMGEV